MIRPKIWINCGYRLNLFGFPNTPAIGNNFSNPGLRDQRLAITWVHDNIRSFGRDPSRMVVAGRSAGSFSISTYQVYAYPDDPLVSGAIMMSGNTALFRGTDSSEYNRVANTLGCTNPIDRGQELECMKSIDTIRLKRAISNNTLNELGGSTYGGAPRIDNLTVLSPEALRQRVAEGKVAKVVCNVLLSFL